MTRRTPPKGGARGTDPVAVTEALLSESAEALRMLLVEVRGGAFGRVDDLVREQALLRKALMATIVERQNLERHLRENDAGGGGHALDLDAARTEVGRRLDRLRAAGQAGGVPGRAE